MVPINYMNEEMKAVEGMSQKFDSVLIQMEERMLAAQARIKRQLDVIHIPAMLSASLPLIDRVEKRLDILKCRLATLSIRLRSVKKTDVEEVISIKRELSSAIQERDSIERIYSHLYEEELKKNSLKDVTSNYEKEAIDEARKALSSAHSALNTLSLLPTMAEQKQSIQSLLRDCEKILVRREEASPKARNGIRATTPLKFVVSENQVLASATPTQSEHVSSADSVKTSRLLSQSSTKLIRPVPDTWRRLRHLVNCEATDRTQMSQSSELHLERSHILSSGMETCTIDTD